MLRARLISLRVLRSRLISLRVLRSRLISLCVLRARLIPLCVLRARLMSLRLLRSRLIPLRVLRARISRSVLLARHVGARCLGASPTHAASRELPLLLLVAARVLDQPEHLARAGRFRRLDIVARQLAIARQLSSLVELPHLLGIRDADRSGHEALQEAVQVVDVADEHLARVAVARGIHRLGKVDHHRTVGGHQHVEVGEIAVHDARAEHSRHLGDELPEHVLRLFGREVQITQARRGLALGIGDELHDQHAVDEVVRLRHADADALQSIDHIDFSRLPRLFVLRLAVLRALRHRALVAAGADLAAFGVLGAVLEIAVLRLFVDLGDAPLAARGDDEDIRFFSALQRPRDLIDHAVLDE